MGDIRRQDVKDVIAAYKNGAFFGLGASFQRGFEREVVVKNKTWKGDGDVWAGTPLKIVGFTSKLGYEETKLKFLNNELYFEARIASADADPATVVVASEPIERDKFGKARSFGLIGATVTFGGSDPDDADLKYATENFVAAKYGPFKIVAESEREVIEETESDGETGTDDENPPPKRAFCALARQARNEIYFDNDDGPSDAKIPDDVADEDLDDYLIDGEPPKYSRHIRGGKNITIENQGLCEHGFVAQINCDIKPYDVEYPYLVMNETGEENVIIFNGLGRVQPDSGPAIGFRRFKNSGGFTLGYLFEDFSLISVNAVFYGGPGGGEYTDEMLVSWNGFYVSGNVESSPFLPRGIVVEAPLKGEITDVEMGENSTTQHLLKLSVDAGSLPIETEKEEFLKSLGEPTTGTFLTELGSTETATVVSNVSTGSSDFLTGFGSAQTGSVVSDVSTSVGNFLTGLGTPRYGSFLTGYGAPETAAVVTDVDAVTSDVLISLGTPRYGTFLTGLGSSTPASVVGSVETNAGKFLTGLGESEPKTFVTALGETQTANVVQEIGEPNYGTFIKELGTPPKSDFLTEAVPTPATVVTDVTTEDKTVVTSVSLAFSESAASGGLAVVVAVECADGSVVETTKYITLNVQTETVKVVKTVTPGTAVVDIETATAQAVTDMPPTEYKDGESASDFEITKTGSAIVNLNPYKIDVIATIADPETETVNILKGEPTDGDAITSVTSTPTEVIGSLGQPDTDKAIKSLPQAQTGTVVTSINPSTTQVLTGLGQGTFGSAMTGIGTPSSAAAVTNVGVSTTNAVMSLGQPETGKAVTSVLQSKIDVVKKIGEAQKADAITELPTENTTGEAVTEIQTKIE